MGIVSFMFYGFMASAVVVVLGVVFLFIYHLNQSIARKGEVPVRWSSIPYLGFALEMGKRPIELLQECAQGKDIFGIVVAGQRMFIVSDPHSTSVILKASNKTLSFEEFHDTILVNFFNYKKEQLDHHVVDGDLARKWYSQYLLSDKALASLTNRLVKELSFQFEDQIKRLDSHTTLDLVGKPTDATVIPFYDFVARFIYHASVSALFNSSESHNPQKADALYQAFVDFDKGLPLAAAGLSLNSFLPVAANARDYLVKKCDTTLSSGLCEMMQIRKDYFIQQEKKYAFFRGEKGKNQVPILWASVGNGIPATFWLLYYLLTHPKILEDVRNEIDMVLPDAKELLMISKQSGDDSSEELQRVLTMENLSKLFLIDACITETLRLSSGSLIMRIVQEDNTELTLASGKTYKFRKGDRVGLCPPLFHFDENFFPDSKEFNPYRWIQGETEEQKAIAALGKIPLSRDGKEVNCSSVFLPFGAGVAYCPGRRFVRNEIKIFMIFLVLNLDLELVDPKKVPEIDGSRAGIGIFPPKDDIELLMKLRQ